MLTERDRDRTSKDGHRTGTAEQRRLAALRLTHSEQPPATDEENRRFTQRDHNGEWRNGEGCHDQQVAEDDQCPRKRKAPSWAAGVSLTLCNKEIEERGDSPGDTEELDRTSLQDADAFDG